MTGPVIKPPLAMEPLMRIRDLQWQGISTWPPEWGVADEGAGEEGILKNVQIRYDQSPTYISVVASHHGDSRNGIIVLEDSASLEILCKKLTRQHWPAHCRDRRPVHRFFPRHPQKIVCNQTRSVTHAFFLAVRPHRAGGPASCMSPKCACILQGAAGPSIISGGPPRGGYAYRVIFSTTAVSCGKAPGRAARRRRRPARAWGMYRANWVFPFTRVRKP